MKCEVLWLPNKEASRYVYSQQIDQDETGELGEVSYRLHRLIDLSVKHDGRACLSRSELQPVVLKLYASPAEIFKK